MRVNVEPLAPCYAEPANAPPGLLLGYANLTESQIDAGVAALARAAVRPPEGHCDMAAVDVEVHTTIDRPRRDVAAYCATRAT